MPRKYIGGWDITTFFKLRFTYILNSQRPKFFSSGENQSTAPVPLNRTLCGRGYQGLPVRFGVEKYQVTVRVSSEEYSSRSIRSFRARPKSVTS